MKRFITIIFYLLIINQAFCINYQSDFIKYLTAKDTINQLKTLEAWQKANPDDPELYTSFFNYHFTKSREEVLSLTTDVPEGKTLEISDSTGKVAGYIGSQFSFNIKELNKGLEKINEGIRRYPNRLDMRFGKIYTLGEIKDWDNFTKEIIEAVRYSKVSDNQWTWTNNEKKKDGKAMFLGSLQDYQLQLYNLGVDSLLVHMRDIALEILKIYPNHVESLSNLSITYMMTNEYDKAIDILLQAETFAPKDPIVLMNVAHAYKMKGDKKNSIVYYKKALKFGDKEAKEYAKQQITELEK
jgi:tetratricopeptide (TPR) repeat protein